MNKRKVFTTTTICVVAIAACLLTFTKPVQIAQSQRRPKEPTLEQHSGGMPDHKIYEFMFHQAAFFKRKAVELEQQGKGAPEAHKFFHRQANLTEAQGLIFDEVSSDCLREVAQQDRKAGEIISAFRARFPKGVVPKGQTLPPPPPELKVMQEERNAIFLKARERLRAAFGEQEFNRFDEHVKTRVVPFAKTR
jgi:hypothetical protein